MTLALTSASFTAGGPIPRKHTCEGADVSPQLAWTGLPEGTASLALIVDDPDARGWTHWLLYNIPPYLAELPEGITPAQLAAGVRHGLNGWDQTGYRGPCPPAGRHRYGFRLLALAELLPHLGLPRKPELEAAMNTHVIAEASLLGTYRKGDR